MKKSNTSDSGPTSDSGRITSLDLIRGIAVLCILLMNVVSIGLGSGPYFNISAGGSDTWLDWTIGILGEIFVDQKFMGLFSLLFGASIVLFADRAEAKGLRATLLSLWRNGLLLGIGFLHSLAWSGDVLMVYGLASPILIVMRKLPPKMLLLLGTATVLMTVPVDIWMQSLVNADQISVEGFWFHSGDQSVDPVSDIAFVPVLINYFARALGMMLIGVAVFRSGVLEGAKPSSFYHNVAIIGFGFGFLLSICGVVLMTIKGYSREVAFLGFVPNTIGTIPATIGYMSIIILWDRAPDHWLKAKLRAVGRMALTNYLMHTVLALLVFKLLLDNIDLTRTMLLVFVFAVWTLQLWFSDAWLSRFSFGPFEWLWRVATYRRFQPMRRVSAVSTY